MQLDIMENDTTLIAPSGDEPSADSNETWDIQVSGLELNSEPCTSTGVDAARVDEMKTLSFIRDFMRVQEMLLEDDQAESDRLVAENLKRADFRDEINKRAAEQLQREEEQMESVRQRDHRFAEYLDKLEREGRSEKCDSILEFMEEEADSLESQLQRQVEQRMCNICLTPALHSKDLDTPCSSSKANSLGIRLEPCQHAYCVNCMVSYITCAVKETGYSFPLTCPLPECDSVLSPESAEMELSLGQALPLEIASKFKALHTLSTKDAMLCPSPTCTHVLVLDDTERLPEKKQSCDKCQTDVCSSCRVVWHADLSCEQFLSLPPEDRHPEDLQVLRLERRAGWRRCPNCRMMIEKWTGCNHIICKCGRHFCYTCGSSYVSSKATLNAEKACKCDLFFVPQEV
jgi:hypothetical protein